MTQIGGSGTPTAVPLPDGAAVRIDWGAATDVGLRRRVNEDSYLARPPVFAVADGMIKALAGPGLGVEIDEAKVRAAAGAEGAGWRNPIWRGPDGAMREW